MFLFTGISASAACVAGKSETGHAQIAVSRTAALFCYAAILSPGTGAQTPVAIPHLDRVEIPLRCSRTPVVQRDTLVSLGSAKRTHFGELSARKE